MCEDANDIQGDDIAEEVEDSKEVGEEKDAQSDDSGIDDTNSVNDEEDINETEVINNAVKNNTYKRRKVTLDKRIASKGETNNNENSDDD